MKNKATLYEAYNSRKVNKKNELNIFKLAIQAVKNILTFLFCIFNFLLAGIGITVLINESTRRAFLLLLSHIKF